MVNLEMRYDHRRKKVIVSVLEYVSSSGIGGRGGSDCKKIQSTSSIKK